MGKELVQELQQSNLWGKCLFFHKGFHKIIFIKVSSEQACFLFAAHWLLVLIFLFMLYFFVLQAGV